MKNTVALDEMHPMVTELAALCERRYHSALAEGLTEKQAFAEMVVTILSTYREAMAS